MVSDDAVWNRNFISIYNKTGFQKCFRLSLHQNITYVLNLWPSTTCVCPFHFSQLATQHNSQPAHERDVRTRRQQNLPDCLLCGDFRVINCVQKSPQSNMMPTDIREAKCACLELYRYEVRWYSYVASLTRQGLTQNCMNWQTEQIQVPAVGGKSYSLATRDFHVGTEAAGAWNWPQFNKLPKLTMHGNKNI
jgi:hypothetical protein